MPTAYAQPSPTHVREHLSILAASEKRLLVWIAERLPLWVTPDHLSGLGLASMLAAGASFAVLDLAVALPIAILCLVTNWFGDSLDGTLARVRSRQRPRYGYYVDHVIDLTGTAALLVGLGASAAMNPVAALAVLAAYLLVCGESYLATHATGVFRISFLGFGPTELRIVLAIGFLKVLLTGPMTATMFGTFRLFDVGGIVAAAALVAVFIASAVGNTRALYRLNS